MDNLLSLLVMRFGVVGVSPSGDAMSRAVISASE